MKFSVIIVNDGYSGNMSRALTAIAAQTQREFEVLVVGANAPLPDDRFKPCNVDAANPLAAKNAAATQAIGEWLFFLTPHSFVAEDCLESLYACSLRFPESALLATTELDNAEPDMIASAGISYSFAGFPFAGGKGWPLDVLPDEGEVFGATTTAMLIRKDVFMAVGGFDADYTACGEDTDLSFRVRLSGHTAMLASEAIVFVKETKPPHNPQSLHARNMVWTYIKNMPDVMFWLNLPFHIIAILISLCSPVHFMARLNGALEALETLPALLQKRKAIQAARKVSLDKLVSSFTWNPYIPFWNRTDIRRKR